MKSTMMDVPLSLNHLLDRAGRCSRATRSSRGCPTSRCARRRTPSTTVARARSRRRCRSSGLKKGERVATLCWNHHAHLECYFGIPAAGGVMHTLNLRLAPDEIAWIANDAEDRFLIVDDVLLPLYRQFAAQAKFEKVIVFPFSGAPVDPAFTELRGAARQRRSRSTSSTRRTPRTTRSRCATRRARPGGRRASSTRTARPCCTP